MNTTVPLLMWNVWRSSGSIVCTALSVSWSSEISSPSTTNMSTPPLANASRKLTGSESTPGQQVVGEDDLLFGAGLRLLAGGLLVEDRGGERRGVAARRPSRRPVRPQCPPAGQPSRWRIVRGS